MARCSGVRAAIALALLGLLLAGCGRRGALEPPPDPRAAAVAVEPGDTLPRRPKPVPIARPNDSFILDPIL